MDGSPDVPELQPLPHVQPHQLLNFQPGHPLFMNPFLIRLFIVEKKFMRQRLIAILGQKLAQTIIEARAPFILPEVSLRPPMWTCVIYILY